MVQISGIIITLNEEKKIEQCIRSLQEVADEIVVVDSFSTDSTESICKTLGVKFIQHTFTGYRDQKNYAVAQATYDIILALDADEVISPELKSSIIEAKKDWIFDAYRISRLNNYCGQWIYHSSWYPEKKIRLFDRRKGRWGGLNVHETVSVDKGVKIGSLKGNILHWSISNYEQHLGKINLFTSISAREYYRLGKRSNLFKIFFNPTWRFFKAYFLRLGFLDGFNGLVICTFSAYSSFLKYIKLRQLQIDNKK